MKPSRTHPAAATELFEAVAWYEERTPGFGKRFHAEFKNAVSRLREQPRSFAAARDGSRACRMHRFPYVLHFVELDAYCWIVAVAHTSRRPNYWKKRLKS